MIKPILWFCCWLCEFLKSTVHLAQKCPPLLARQQSPTVGPVVGTLHSKAFILSSHEQNEQEGARVNFPCFIDSWCFHCIVNA